MDQRRRDHATEEAKKQRKAFWPWRHILKQPNRNYSHLFISFQNKITKKKPTDGIIRKEEENRKRERESVCERDRDGVKKKSS